MLRLRAGSSRIYDSTPQVAPFRCVPENRRNGREGRLYVEYHFTLLGILISKIASVSHEQGEKSCTWCGLISFVTTSARSREHEAWLAPRIAIIRKNLKKKHIWRMLSSSQGGKGAMDDLTKAVSIFGGPVVGTLIGIGAGKKPDEAAKDALTAPINSCR
jgi:hypothetical protein